MWNGDSQTETGGTENVQGEGEEGEQEEEEEEDNIFHWQDTLMREVRDEYSGTIKINSYWKMMISNL